MTDLLDRVGLPETMREALLGADSEMGHVLRLAQAYEAAEWGACDELVTRLSVNESALSDAYLESVTWTTRFAEA